MSSNLWETVDFFLFCRETPVNSIERSELNLSLIWRASRGPARRLRIDCRLCFAPLQSADDPQTNRRPRGEWLAARAHLRIVGWSFVAPIQSADGPLTVHGSFWCNPQTCLAANRLRIVCRLLADTQWVVSWSHLAHQLRIIWGLSAAYPRPIYAPFAPHLAIANNQRLSTNVLQTIPFPRVLPRNTVKRGAINIDPRGAILWIQHEVFQRSEQ